MNSVKKQNKKAFTLVELLIVITIIGILFVVLITRVDFATDKAKTTGVQTDFNAYKIAFQMAATNHQGFDPIFVNTDAVTAQDGTVLKPAKSAAENLLDALNDDLDDTLDLTLAYGEKAQEGVATYAGEPVDNGMTFDMKDETDEAKGAVKAVYYTEHLDPWKESYIIYYCAGQQETVTIGSGADAHEVVRNVADGNIHGNRGCICMISKGPNVDEELVWDNTAIDPEGLDAWDSSSNIKADDGAGKVLFSGSFVPADGADDLVLNVSYTFKLGTGAPLITTFGFTSNTAD